MYIISVLLNIISLIDQTFRLYIIYILSYARAFWQNRRTKLQKGFKCTNILFFNNFSFVALFLEIYIFSIAFKPINIRWITSGSQSYWKIMYGIVLYPVFYDYKRYTHKIKTRFFARAFSISGLKILVLIL